MTLNARSKGSRGEREFSKWLQDALGLEIAPNRNLDQVRDGGADIVSIKPFMFEVKRCETLQKQKWWLQVCRACIRDNDIPVVAYRQNRKSWVFLISAKLIGNRGGFIQLEEKMFLDWFRRNYEAI